MATNIKNTCSVCLGNYDRPKLLPCHHTFCEGCIDGVIEASTRGNKFNCPTCRKQITVPRGGACQFVTNFYLEDHSDDTAYCSKHKKTETGVYCRDCRKPCCSVCVLLDHKDHTLAVLQDVDQEMRELVKKLKTESAKKVKRLQEHCDFLETLISDVNNSCESACDNVDKQIQNTCDEFWKIGDGIKSDINTIQKDEISKLTKLVNDVRKEAGEMKKLEKSSDDILKSRSIITAVDAEGLEDIQTNIDYNISPQLQKPAVRHPYYFMVDVDVDRLEQLLGEMQTATSGGEPPEQLQGEIAPTVGGDVQTVDGQTFTSSFSLNLMKPGRFYYGDDVMKQGLTWRVRIKHDQETLYITLGLRTVEDKTIKTVRASLTLKLLNIIDANKSLVKQRSDTLSPCRRYSNHVRMISWDKLRCPENGFIDANRTFTVQATVNVTKIKR